MRQVAIEITDEIAIVRLQNAKVNAISHQLTRELKESFLALEQDTDVKGAILTGETGVFSAGLDVLEQATMDEAEAEAFWIDYFEALQAMIRYSKPFVCAISGYAPAGGAIFTLCADYRIMASEPKHIIGMHEFKLSMQIPALMLDIWTYTLGEQKAFQSIQTAKLFSAQEALQENIVQEIAPADEVLERAKQHLQKALAVYAPVYIETKRLARKQLLALVDRDMKQLAKEFVAFGKDPELKKRVQLFAEQLKKNN